MINRVYGRASFQSIHERGRTAQGAEPTQQPYVVTLSSESRAVSQTAKSAAAPLTYRPASLSAAAQASAASAMAGALRMNGIAASLSALAGAIGATASSAEAIGEAASADAQADAARTGRMAATPTQRKPAGNEALAQAGREMNAEELRQVEELKKQDQTTRAHETAHKAALGRFAKSGPTYAYESGPDGKRYAVEGKVTADSSPETSPEQTIAKAQTIRRAALAPADPSAQDRLVAAEMSRMEQQARMEKAESERRESDKNGKRAESRGGSPIDELALRMQEMRERLDSIGAAEPDISVLAA